MRAPHPRILTIATAVLGLAASVGTASALRRPGYLASTPRFEVASGVPARAERWVTYGKGPTPAAARAWAGFLSAHGKRWRTMWDQTTGVPLRIYGEGIPAPGTVASAAKAEAFARRLLASHIALLAPGSTPADFVLYANVLDAEGARTVAFRQTYDGMPVLGGQVSFQFKDDRMFLISSEAYPAVRARTAALRVSGPVARGRAGDWVHADFGGRTSASAAGGPYVLPIVRADGRVEFHTVLSVTVDSQQPIGRWDVYVDAATGKPVARRQKLMFATGTLSYNIPPRSPTLGYKVVPAAFAQVTLNGTSATADANGVLTWSGTSAATFSINGVSGPYATVTNASGSGLTASGTIDSTGTTLDRSGTELDDAQLDAYVDENVVKNYVRGINPKLAWLDQQVTMEVNLPNDNKTVGPCNAYSDGDAVHFVASTPGKCENTARIADVVYHETGHSVHAHSIIDGFFDASLAEGVADYLAVTITNDPGVGRGFFFTQDPLRDLDPAASGQPLKVYPDDFDFTSMADPHANGEIIGETLWDMRKGLIKSLGQQQGVAHSDQLWYAILEHATDIPSTYPAVLAADDDDGNLANGTPNECVIDAAFAAHGLAGPAAFGIGLPTYDNFKVTLPVSTPADGCPASQVSSATLLWHLRSDASGGGMVTMTSTGSGYSGTIPTQAAGTVVEYQIDVKLGNGHTITLPRNRADPWYQYFVGAVKKIYCTDFEADPTADGWTHGATTGTDNWQWGAAKAGNGGDPGQAHSGTKVFGMALGGNYANKSDVYAKSPMIDLSGYSGDDIRLQYYRWLNVEDGQFDQATISANGQQAWANVATKNGNDQHRDHEWRFQDIDLNPYITGNSVQVQYELKSDPGLNFGGWTIDDFCVVAYAGKPASVCGDGIVESGEQCDDGNTVSGDGCSSTCQKESGKLGPDGGGSGVGLDGGGAGGGGGGCGCRVGTGGGGTGTGGWLFGLGALALLVGLRRRRRPS